MPPVANPEGWLPPQDKRASRQSRFAQSPASERGPVCHRDDRLALLDRNIRDALSTKQPQCDLGAFPCRDVRVVNASADDALIHLTGDRAVHGNVRPGHNLSQRGRRQHPCAASVASDAQVQDCSPRRKVREAAKQLLERHVDQVRERHLAFIPAQLPSSQCFEVTGVQPAGNDDHLSRVRLQFQNEIEGTLWIDPSSDTGHPQTGRLQLDQFPIGRQRNDWHTREEVRAICPYEFERGSADYDDNIESRATVLASEKIAERRLVVLVGESRRVYEFRVVVNRSLERLSQRVADDVLALDVVRCVGSELAEHQHTLLLPLCLDCAGRAQQHHHHNRNNQPLHPVSFSALAPLCRVLPGWQELNRYRSASQLRQNLSHRGLPWRTVRQENAPRGSIISV